MCIHKNTYSNRHLVYEHSNDNSYTNNLTDINQYPDLYEHANKYFYQDKYTDENIDLNTHFYINTDDHLYSNSDTKRYMVFSHPVSNTGMYG